MDIPGIPGIPGMDELAVVELWALEVFWTPEVGDGMIIDPSIEAATRAAASIAMREAFSCMIDYWECQFICSPRARL
jgi:hypothetical protein